MLPDQAQSQPLQELQASTAVDQQILSAIRSTRLALMAMQRAWLPEDPQPHPGQEPQASGY
jgi:hypothetical protein